MSANKKESGLSIHHDPFMEWGDTSICRKCLNRMPMQGTECDVFDNVVDVNNAIWSGQCEFFLERESVETK